MIKFQDDLLRGVIETVSTNSNRGMNTELRQGLNFAQTRRYTNQIAINYPSKQAINEEKERIIPFDKKNARGTTSFHSIGNDAANKDKNTENRQILRFKARNRIEMDRLCNSSI